MHIRTGLFERSCIQAEKGEWGRVLGGNDGDLSTVGRKRNKKEQQRSLFLSDYLRIWKQYCFSQNCPNFLNCLHGRLGIKHGSSVLIVFFVCLFFYVCSPIREDMCKLENNLETL